MKGIKLICARNSMEYQRLSDARKFVINILSKICPTKRCTKVGACGLHDHGEFCSKDVPSGYLPVYVGLHQRRFMVKVSLLNHPIFRELLEKAEEEYGFQRGRLVLPCSEDDFNCILSLLQQNEPILRYVRVDELLNCCRMNKRNWPCFEEENSPLLRR